MRVQLDEMRANRCLLQQATPLGRDYNCPIGGTYVDAEKGAHVKLLDGCPQQAD